MTATKLTGASSACATIWEETSLHTMHEGQSHANLMANGYFPYSRGVG